MNERDAVKRKLAEQMQTATVVIEEAARAWQQEYPEFLPACFHMAQARFIARSFAFISEDGFEALIKTMRAEHADWKVKR